MSTIFYTPFALFANIILRFSFCFFFIELHRQVNNFKQTLPEKEAGGGLLCIFEVSLHRVRPFTLASYVKKYLYTSPTGKNVYAYT